MLFLDLDETLIKSVTDERDANTNADFSILVDAEPFHVFVRPDIDVLKGTTFRVYTAATASYARPIVNVLANRYGLDIRGLLTRRHLGAFVADGPAVIIDNKPADTVLTSAKLGSFSIASSVLVQPFDIKDGVPGLYGRGASLRDAVKWAQSKLSKDLARTRLNLL